MEGLLKILILEDSSPDADLMIYSLKRELHREFEYRLVKNKDEYIRALDEYDPEIVLSDYNLPSFTGLEALEILQAKKADLPLVIVTGNINEETAVNCMKAGAADYVLKENLTRLSSAIQNSLEKYKLISAQKGTKEALDKSEKELNSIFNSSPVKIMVVKNDLKIQKINKTALDFLGRTFEEVYNHEIGKSLNCESYVNNSCFNGSRECNNCELAGFIRSCIQHETKAKDKEVNINILAGGIRQAFIFHVYVEPLTVKPAETFLVTLIDISERKRALQMLIESEKKFRELADSLPEIVFETDSSARFTFLNNSGFQKFNVDPSVVNPGQLSVHQFIHPDDTEKLAADLNRGLRGEKITGNDYKILLPDGNSGYFQIFNTLVYTEGKVTGFRGIAVDVTERKKLGDELAKHRDQLETLVTERTADFEAQAKQLKESQLALSYLLDDVNESREELLVSNREIKKLSQALEQSPSSVAITDIEGTIEYVNRQFEVSSGYAASELIGKNSRILNSGTHPKEFFTAMWDKIKSGHKWSDEICNRNKNGELYWEFISISPLRNADQEIINFITVKEDITEKKIIEQKIKEYTEELELFNKAMVDRELKIIEMKEEVNSLRGNLGLGLKYPPVWDEKSDLP